MKAAFFDVDGTLTKKPIWQGMADYFKINRKGHLGIIAFWIYITPLYLLYKIGLLSQKQFRKPWAQHLPWYLIGMREDEAVVIWDWMIDNFIIDVIWKDSVELVKRHVEAGDLVVFVSASPEPIIQRIAAMMGVDHVVATRPKLKNGKYTGGVDGDVCFGGNKVKLVTDYLQLKGFEIDLELSFAYADSPGDVDLLELVGNPVATHPDKNLLSIAIKKNWKIFPVK